MSVWRRLQWRWPPGGPAVQERLELVGDWLTVHDAVEEPHLIFHNAVEPQRRLLAGVAILNGPVHLRAVVDPGALVIFLLDS